MKGIVWKCLGLLFFFFKLRSNIFILVKVVIKRELYKLAAREAGNPIPLGSCTFFSQPLCGFK